MSYIHLRHLCNSTCPWRLDSFLHQYRCPGVEHSTEHKVTVSAKWVVTHIYLQELTEGAGILSHLLPYMLCLRVKARKDCVCLHTWAQHPHYQCGRRSLGISLEWDGDTHRFASVFPTNNSIPANWRQLSMPGEFLSSQRRNSLSIRVWQWMPLNKR